MGPAVREEPRIQQDWAPLAVTALNGGSATAEVNPAAGLLTNAAAVPDGSGLGYPGRMAERYGVRSRGHDTSGPVWLAATERDIPGSAHTAGCAGATSKPGAVPAPAAAAGYNTLTFGPKVTLNKNWSRFSYMGINPASIQAAQNADGSVTIDYSGNPWGGQLSSSEVFGNGGYFEATMAFPHHRAGGGAFWANDIQNMHRNNKGNWIEVDIAEFDQADVYGFAMHNWYGVTGSGAKVDTGPISGSPASPAGADYARPNKYGFLWVPATATTKGYGQYFFNGAQVGHTITWDQYDPAMKMPPVLGSTAFSVLDSRQLSLILGTGGSPTTVYGVSVWQAACSDASRP